MSALALTDHAAPLAPAQDGVRRLPGAGTILALTGAAIFAWCWVSAAYALRPLLTWEDLYRYVQRYSIDPYYNMAIPERLIDYPLSEYGWQLLVLAIFEAGLSFETAFFAISMVALGLTAYVILRRTGSALGLLLLVHPAQIDFFISQVRSALAFSIVLVGLQRSFPVAISTILLASLLHTSMLLFAIPLAIDFARQRIGKLRESGHFWPLAAFATASLIAAFQILILDYLGDRRASYAVFDLGAGSLLTASWAAIGIGFYFLAGRRASRTGIAACFLLGMFIFSSLLGFYAHRYAAYLVPLLALAMTGPDTPRANKVLFLGAYGLFSLTYFGFWL